MTSGRTAILQQTVNQHIVSFQLQNIVATDSLDEGLDVDVI